MIERAFHHKHQISGKTPHIDVEIDRAISSGLHILKEQQRTCDSFVATQISGDGNKKEINSPFVAALILSILSNFDQINNALIPSLIHKISKFLYSQIDSDGFVCFFGKSSTYPRDTDDTAMVWYSLLSSQCLLNPDPKYDILKKNIYRFIREDGSVRIWIDREHNTNFDYVVTCNVYRFLKTVLRIDNFLSRNKLLSFFKTDEWKKGSPYYANPYVALSVALGADATILNLISLKTRSKMIDDLTNTIFDKSIEKTLIPFIAFILSSLNFKDIRIIELLIETQEKNSFWISAPLFRHVNRQCYYVSDAISTVFAISALQKLKI